MTQTLLYSLFVAFSFSLWPILTRFAKVPIVWTAILVNAATLVAAVCYLIYKGDSTPTTKMVWIGIIAGLINGAGFLVYSNLLAKSNLNVSTVVAVIDILIPIVAVILGVFFLKEAVSFYKILGLLLACAGIYLLLKQ